nr:hypothetical protein GCM10020092_046440 [Actinoplanes digitatis]
MNRVKQADADFTAAQAGVTDQTPLRQASERFNAAAVALEMSWLRLLADAGCLSGEQEDAARDYTEAVQKSLAEAGYYDDEVDGVYGPSTVAAVQALQKANDLPETGAFDKATAAELEAELRAKGGAAAGEAIASTAALQQTLKLAQLLDRPGGRHLDPGTDRGPEVLPRGPARRADRRGGRGDDRRVRARHGAAVGAARDPVAVPEPLGRWPVQPGDLFGDDVTDGPGMHACRPRAQPVPG